MRCSIMGVRRAVAERNEAHRVAALGLDVLILEDIVDRPPRAIRVAAVRSARVGQGDHDLRHHRTAEGDHPSP